MSDDIYKRYWTIQSDRRVKMNQLMLEYDETVYTPAMIQLRQDCEKDGGHRGGKYHDNGFGWSWFYCARCGARYDIKGPNGRNEE